MATKTRARPKAARETPAHRKARFKKLLARLEQAYPEAVCALSHHSALELLVATILSAQSTDARVNMVTPALFAKYRDAMAYAAADPAVLEQEIHSTGFFRNKTKSIIGMAQGLVERHGGQVPDTIEALVELPGVGRKTANVVLGTWFGKNEGVVVDTHVQRLSTLLGLTQESTPEKIERDLMALVPRARWT
jgi:endonuclease-3